MPPVAQPRNRKSHHCGYAYALRLTKQELLPASVNCRLSPTLADSRIELPLRTYPKRRCR